jgi:hypothetical protein
MKNRLFTSLLILALSVTFVCAQDSRKTSFAIIGGLNLQNLTGKAYNGDKLNNDMLLGYHIGVNAQIPIASKFYFQPGLLYAAKGAKTKSESSTSTTNINYLEMPLNVVYKTPCSNGSFIAGFGPYVAYGIGGKVKTTGDSPTIETKIEFKNVIELTDPLDVPFYKAFDAGAGAFVGYEMTNGVFCQLNMQLGLLKINSEYREFPDDKTSVKNTGFGLSTGYRF